MTRWVVILAGGIGSRFWPLSTPERPKQLLPLVGDEPMLVATVRRVRAISGIERTLILTNAALREPIARAIPDLPPGNILVEPAPAGTAAALAWAACEIARRDRRDATMLSVHADWAIGDDAGFQRTLADAATLAERERVLVTVGIVPSRNDPGFGYIMPAAAGGSGAQRVARFIEKPDREKARQLIAEGALWNSGLFAWRVDDFLDEIAAHTPEIAPACRDASGDAARFFSTVRPISVDHGVMERSTRVMVLPGTFGWDDVGTWAALSRVRSRDRDGNAVQGRAILEDSTNNVVHAEGTGAVVLYGVDGLVVVTKPGITFITTIDRAADLKPLVESLPADLKSV